jgi:hypothetical protein
VDAALAGAAAQYLFEDSINLGAFVIPASIGFAASFLTVATQTPR